MGGNLENVFKTCSWGLRGVVPRRRGDGRLALEGGARSVAGMTIGQGCNQGEASPFLLSTAYFLLLLSLARLFKR
ncbi:hypothetical protein B7990_11655 [Fibrobacter sp. UWB4]|nr:hypothetical protein B7990_11655 [Fibrobacter sp. UWB4]